MIMASPSAMAKSLRERYDELRVSYAPQRGRADADPEDPFIVRVTQLLLSYGVDCRASDIHIEPTASGGRIRYRIDGFLHEMLQVPPEVRDPLVRSIKVKASMTTDAVGRSKPQDGRIDFESNGRKLDLRLSSFPTLYGDVMAIRILDRSAPLLTMEQLGFPQSMLKEFAALTRRPNGLILVTGPANSGKTTTLYGVLHKLRSPHIKIVTLEDPVEYQLEGIDQATINSAVGLTFASGLRAILRQDANVILVGEIRDKETAEIGIRAALTGHLVLSTLHTRHSCGAVTRLIDMGIEPHLLVASINGILAQRLIRVLCPKCKEPDPLAAKTVIRILTQETGSAPPNLDLGGVSRGKGCVACNMTGYQGRTGVFELLSFTDELKRLVLDRDSGRLYKAAVLAGMRTMVLDGIEKITQGVTTVEEVLRVIGESEDF